MKPLFVCAVTSESGDHVAFSGEEEGTERIPSQGEGGCIVGDGMGGWHDFLLVRGALTQRRLESEVDIC